MLATYIADLFLIFVSGVLVRYMIEKQETPIWAIVLVILFLSVGLYGLLFDKVKEVK